MPSFLWIATLALLSVNGYSASQTEPKSTDEPSGRYVLDLAASGLDPAHYADGIYTREHSGPDGCRVAADTPWVFRWTPDPERLAEPPQSVVILHQVSASISTEEGTGTVFNGYEGGNRDALEFFAIANPGETLTLGTQNFPAAVVERGAGSCRLQVGFEVTPITLHLEGAMWPAGHTRPAVLTGRQVRAEVQPSHWIETLAWEISGDHFAQWNIARTPPLVDDGSRVVQSSRRPEWIWRASESETATVAVSARLRFPRNRYLQREANVSANLQVDVVAPKLELGMPSFKPISTIRYDNGQSSTLMEVTLPAPDVSSLVSQLGGGQVVFLALATIPEPRSSGSPAQFRYRLGQEAMIVPLRSDDGLSLSLGNFRAYEDIRYSLYALFQPDAPHSAPIPLKRLDWRAMPAGEGSEPGELRGLAQPWARVTEFPVWTGQQGRTVVRFATDAALPIPPQREMKDIRRLEAEQALWSRVRNLVAIGEYADALQLQQGNPRESRTDGTVVALLFALGRTQEALHAQAERTRDPRNEQLLAIMRAHESRTVPDYAELLADSPDFDLATGAELLVRQLAAEFHFPLMEVVYTEFLRLQPDPEARQSMAEWIGQRRAESADRRHAALSRN